jgi:hypothetical protein
VYCYAFEKTDACWIQFTLQAAVAVLRFILMHAAKYDVARTDLVEELQQLGVQQGAAETIAQSYEELRLGIQDEQRAQRFQVKRSVYATSTAISLTSFCFPAHDSSQAWRRSSGRWRLLQKCIST